MDELLPDAVAVLSLSSTCTVTRNLRGPHANFDFHESPTNVGGDSIDDSGDDSTVINLPDPSHSESNGFNPTNSVPSTTKDDTVVSDIYP